MGARQKLLILLVAAAAIAALTASAPASAVPARTAGQGASFAAGAYVLQVPGLTDTRRFAFSVIRLPNGTVVGDAFAHNPVSHTDTHTSLNCFIREGNQGIVGGIVTDSTDPALVGLPGAFAIQDNLDAIGFFLNNGGDPAFPPITCGNLLEQAGVPNITGLLTGDFAVPWQSTVFLSPR